MEKAKIIFELPDGYGANLDDIEFCEEFIKVPLIKVKPKRIVFESTGEKRCPQAGEFFINGNGIFHEATTNLWETREIYSLVEDSE